MDIIDHEDRGYELQLTKYKGRINGARMLLHIYMLLFIIRVLKHISADEFDTQIIKIGITACAFLLSKFAYRSPFKIMMLLTAYAFLSTFGRIEFAMYVNHAQWGYALMNGTFIAILMLYCVLVTAMVFGTMWAKKYERIKQIKDDAEWARIYDNGTEV